MKIVADATIPFVSEAFSEFGEVITVPGRSITREMIMDCSILLVRMYTKVDENLLGGTGVKFVASASTGIDHIDTQYLEREHIGFAYMPGVNADATAEYVLTAILHLVHSRGLNLKGMVLGIVGAGAVGNCVLKKAQYLGINCLVNDPPKERLTQSPSYVPLADLLSQADIVSIHVPLLTGGPDPTFHLVGKEFLAQCKDGVMLINTSRGNVVNEHELLEYGNRKVSGLVLDVWENEPLMNVMLLERVDIATPHIAGYSHRARVNGTHLLYEAACAFFFKEKRWMPPLSHGTKDPIITVRELGSGIYPIVNQAYPIMDDDGRFRKIVELDGHKQTSFFDDLRKKYEMRYEFSQHVITGSDLLSADDRAILSRLGFRFA